MNTMTHARSISRLLGIPVAIALAIGVATAPASATIPSDISNLYLWVHAEDAETSGIPSLDGQTVTFLPDRSTSNIDLDNNDGTTPTFSATGFLGNPGITLDSVSDRLRSTLNFGIGTYPPPAFTVFVHAIVTDTTDGNRYLSIYGNPSNTRQAIAPAVDTTSDRFLGDFGNGDTRVTANDSMDSLYGTPTRFAFRFTGGAGTATSTSELYLNGVSSATGGGSGLDPGFANTPFYLGGNGTFGSAQMLIQEIVVYNRALTTTEMAELDLYFQNQNAVPEPSTVLLMLLGGGLVVRKLRK